MALLTCSMLVVQLRIYCQHADVGRTQNVSHLHTLETTCHIIIYISTPSTFAGRGVNEV